MALSAINKFILYGFLAPDSAQTGEVLCRTAEAASLVRFERIDRSIDEQVYLQICTTLLHCIICPAGKLLSDSAVWLCVKTCYEISISETLSPIVCRFAEDVLMQMVLSVFSHVSSMPGEDAGDMGTLALRDPLLPLPTELGSDHTPHNAQCVLFICRWLFSLVDPQKSSEQRRVYGLGLVNVALETSGQMIGLIPPVVEMIGHDLCKYLLQNSHSNSVPILSLSLRVIFNLFNSSVKGNLKVQLEVFFNTIHLRVPAAHVSSDSDEEMPYEKKELVLESLVEFCSEPELMVDLFCNYDLDLSSSNLFEKLTAFLAANTFSDTGHFNSLHRLCLEALLAVVESVAQMFCQPSSTLHLSEDTAGDDTLTKTKAEKKLIKQAADQWNKNKKKSLGTLASMGAIPSATDPEGIAKFLRQTPGLDLDSVGEFFGKISDEFNQSVFAQFVLTFDFAGKGLDMALRVFLESFKLPGEAQQVSTILEAFAARYFEHNPDASANEDTIFILSFSIIMLNTDLHNDGVKNKMTLEEFIRNNRGIDDGKDLPQEFLTSIYNEIRDNEIKMTPDVEAMGGEGGLAVDDKQWEQLLRSQSGGQISSGGATLAVGRDMFTLIWHQVVSAMCMSLDTSSPVHDERVVHKVLAAFEHVVHIAGFFQLQDILNNAIVSLCKSLRKQAEVLSGLIERSGPAAAFRDSTSKKALQIVQTLFRVVHAHFSLLREAWLNVIECVVLLNRGQLKLLPTDLTDVDDFLDASGRPLASSVSQLATAAQRAGGEEELSFLNLFFPPEEEELEQKRAADQEAEVAMRATVATCDISGLFVTSKKLTAEILPHLITALVQCSGGVAQNGANQPAPQGNVFNDVLLSQIYCLEWLTNVCRHNLFRIDVLWPLVSSFFEDGLAAVQSATTSAAGPMKPRLFLERIVVSILRLCCYFEDGATISSPRGPRSPVDTLFATLRPLLQLPDAVVLSLGSRFTSGMLMLLRSNGSMLREEKSWEMVFEICDKFAQQPASSECTLESLHYIITSHPELYMHSGPRYMKILLNVAGTARKDSPVERSHTVANSLLFMHETLSSATGLSEVDSAERRVQTLVWLATQTLDPRPDAHNYAMSMLHKALFSSTVATPDADMMRRFFDEIFYRLLPEIIRHFRPGDDIRVKSFNLLSQAFLHNMALLRTLPDIDGFLAGYLGFTRQYFAGNHDETVLDSISGILRNTMMVMSVEGLLVAVPVWAEASALLDRFCPDLRQSLQPGGSPYAAVEAEVARKTAEAAAAKLAAEQEAERARSEADDARRTLAAMQKSQLGAPAPPPGPPSPAVPLSVDNLRAMKVSALQKLAVKRGIDEDLVDDTMEADRPKDALIELIMREEGPGPEEAPQPAVPAEPARPAEEPARPEEPGLRNGADDGLKEAERPAALAVAPPVAADDRPPPPSAPPPSAPPPSAPPPSAPPPSAPPPSAVEAAGVVEGSVGGATAGVAVTATVVVEQGLPVDGAAAVVAVAESPT